MNKIHLEIVTDSNFTKSRTLTFVFDGETLLYYNYDDSWSDAYKKLINNISPYDKTGRYVIGQNIMKRLDR